jgi:Na+-driven multidrug efflux pump
MKLFADGTSHSQRRSLDRDILALAIPVFIAQGIVGLVGFAGRVFVSQLGPQAFNGINIAMMVFFLIVTIIAPTFRTLGGAV